MEVLQDIRKQFSNWRDEFHPRVLADSLLSSLLIYIIEIITVISFAALVFSGELVDQLPQALGFILVADAILIGLITLLSSYPGSIGAAQDAPSAVIGLVAVKLIVALPALAAAQHYATAVMMIVITTVMTGGLFLALGIFKLGSLARYLPYPVMGGFLAGTGWLLTRGGLDIMVGIPFSLEWFEPQIILRWLPGTLLGVIIFISVTRTQQPMTMPILLALGALTFYVVTAVMNVPPAQLESEGWLVGSLPSGSLVRFPFRAEVLSQVDWRLLLQQLPKLIPAALISVIALLLNSGGMELVIKKDLNLNRELIAAGVGNLVAGSLGGLPGYHAVSLSTLNHKMSGGKRLVGLFTALLVGVTIFVGTPVISYIPKIILGAILLFVGVALLVEWTYVIIVSILGVIMVNSFLNGVILGLVLAIIMFVVSYSGVSIIKYALSGQEHQSRVTRSSGERQLLEAHGDQIYILMLQGFIFFGTANSIFDRLRERIQSQPPGSVRYILLDFTQVSGLDSTGLLSFRRMLQWCEEQKIVLVLTGLRDRALQQFTRGGFSEQPGIFHFFSDLDHGVEWCEDEIIAETSTGEPTKRDLVAELKAIVGEHRQVEKLLPHMNRREYAPGEYLIRQGDEPDRIYFIDSGQVTAQLEVPDQPTVRLERMGSGRSVGELGFYLEIKRTAAVIVDEPSVIFSLSKQQLAKMEQADPEAANLFHRIIVHLLGERVVHLIRTVNALER
jgi:SulP family sulfate permease